MIIMGRMNPLFSILIAIIAVVVVVIVLMQISTKSAKKKPGKHKVKSPQLIIKEATRKLSQDPHNITALMELSNVYYTSRQWEKALPLLETMTKIFKADSPIDLAQTTLRLGTCQMRLGQNTDALDTLNIAFKLQRENPEVNHSLGQTLYQLQEYDKAIPYFKRAVALDDSITGIDRQLGLAYFYSKHSRDALPYLKRALDENPENRECLYAMATSMQDTGMNDKALKIFLHLRADPEFGAKSCLAAGNIHFNTNQFDQAIEDYEIGLKHQDAPVEIQAEISYKLANCYIRQNNISKGLSILTELNNSLPGYKDVPSLITRYAEMSQNANLQLYLISGSGEFVSLCRKVVTTYFARSKLKILDISVTSEYTEILADIETAQWQDTALFRFYRITGSVGELHVRDFYGKVQDTRAGQGICVIAGSYSTEALKFSEGRPINLVDKNKLISILRKIDKAG